MPDYSHWLLFAFLAIDMPVVPRRLDRLITSRFDKENVRTMSRSARMHRPVSTSHWLSH